MNRREERKKERMSKRAKKKKKKKRERERERERKIGFNCVDLTQIKKLFGSSDKK